MRNVMRETRRDPYGIALEAALRNLELETTISRLLVGALGRIVNGTYGRCSRCSETISPKPAPGFAVGGVVCGLSGRCGREFRAESIVVSRLLPGRNRRVRFPALAAVLTVDFATFRRVARRRMVSRIQSSARPLNSPPGASFLPVPTALD